MVADSPGMLQIQSYVKLVGSFEPHATVVACRLNINQGSFDHIPLLCEKMQPYGRFTSAVR